MKITSWIKICAVLCLALFLSVVTGCETVDPSVVAEAFLDCIANQDFETAYSYIWPYDNDALDKDAFIAKYEAVFSGLEIESMEVYDTFATTDSFGTTYTYTCSYITKSYGIYTYDFSMDLKHVDDEVYVNWGQDLIFPFMDFEDKLLIETLKASRGEIFTSDGELVAENAYGLAVYMDVTKIKNILTVCDALSPILDVTQNDIIEVFNKTLALNEQLGRNNVGVIDSYALDHFTDEQKAAIVSIEGIGIDTETFAPIRYYPYKEYMAHILGYMGYITEEYLEAHPDRGYNTDSMVGKAGLEAEYEDVLRGTDGKIVYVADKWGNQKVILYEDPVEEGKDLILNIDLDTQIKAYKLLANNTYKNQNGVAIVLDAKTGAVEAMCSYPSYDNNIFSFPVDTDTWNSLISDDSNQPMYDRCTQGLYPPGSLIKPFTIVPALELGVLTPSTEFTGTIVNNQWMPNRSDWNSKPITRAGNSGSPLTLTNALIHSDNIYFAWAALKVGEENLVSYLKRIGFESEFDFDLDVGMSNITNTGTNIYPRMLADLGYGQAQMLISPIQMSSLFSAYANGTGDSVRPMLVKEIKQTQGTDYVTIETMSPEIAVYDVFKDSTYNTILPLLKRVITEGTGRRAQTSGVTLAGKTGTAEVGTYTAEISWFASFWVNGSYNRQVLVALESKEGQGNVKFIVGKALLTP